jgi:predicted glutamine amidotransferase
LLAVDPALFPEVLGTTDSEVMFHLGLTFGLEEDPLGALSRMATFVERTGHAHGVKEPLTMTLGLSDGSSIWAVRYASDGQAPTLYYSPSPESFRAMNPDAAGALGAHARAVVSEPVGQFAEQWIEIAQSSAIHVHDGEVEVMPFEVAR